MTLTVHIISLKQTIPIDGNESILDAALLAGIEYPFGCMEGQCGACKTRLLSGEIHQGDSKGLGLSEQEISSGWFLACQARAISNLEIDFVPAAP
jgi:ferredoxin